MVERDLELDQELAFLQLSFGHMAYNLLLWAMKALHCSLPARRSVCCARKVVCHTMVHMQCNVVTAIPTREDQFS